MRPGHLVLGIAAGAALALGLWVWQGARTRSSEPGAGGRAASRPAVPEQAPVDARPATASRPEALWTCGVEVVDAELRPVPGASVDLHVRLEEWDEHAGWEPDGSPRGGITDRGFGRVPVATVRADDRGRAALPMPAEEVCIRARRLGLGASPSVLCVRPLPGAREPAPLRLELAGERVVRGIVIDATGRPLPGARVEAACSLGAGVEDPLHEEWVETGTDKDARFQIALPRDELCEIVGRHLGLAGQPFVLHEGDDPPALLELTVAFDAVVRGTVLDERGEPATDVLVRMWPKSAAAEPAEAGIAASRADARGRFALACRAPAELLLQAARDDGDRTPRIAVRVGAGGSPAAQELRLLGLAAISGRVTDLEGQPWPDALLVGTCADSDVALEARADAAGAFELPGALRGASYRLELRDASVPRARIAAGAATAPSLGLVLRADRGRLATAEVVLRVVRPPGLGGTDVTVVVDAHTEERERHALAPSADELRLVKVPAGLPIDLDVEAPGAEPWRSRGLVLSPGEVRRLEAGLERRR